MASPPGPSGYTTSKLGARGRLREYARLVTVHRNPHRDVEAVASTLTRAIDRIEAELGRPIQGCRVVDVGAGQRRIAASVFAAAGCTAIALDAEVVPSRLTIRTTVGLARREGAVRATKTVARRALGLDRRFGELLCARLGVRQLSPPASVCMDACELGLRGEAVDVVFSRCLFEHLGDPAKAATELARVLRPGGLMYLAINPFTGPLGAHDPDVMSGRVPMDWAHVQRCPSRRSTSNAFLNRWRVSDYERMFAELLPGCSVASWSPPDCELEARLSQLVDAGELDGFARSELLAREVVVVWRK